MSLKLNMSIRKILIFLLILKVLRIVIRRRKRRRKGKKGRKEGRITFCSNQKIKMPLTFHI